VRRRAESVARVLLVAGSLVFSLAIAELFLRLAGFVPERYGSIGWLVSPDGRAALDCYPSDPRRYFPIDLRQDSARARFHSFAPHRYESIARRVPHAVELRYNSSGFRGAEIAPRRPGVRRVALLGDSFTEGQGVVEQDTYSSRLQALLEAGPGGRWEVLNCGRRATDFPALRHVFDEVLALEPDVIVYAMVLNDPEQAPSFRGRQSYLNDWIIDRRRMSIHQPGHALAFFDLRLQALAEDRLESYRVGRDSVQWYLDMYGEPNREGWRRTQGYLREMASATRRRGGSFVVARWPILVGLEGGYPFAAASEAIERACAALGIASHDLLPALRAAPTESLWVHPLDMHPNDVAHRLAAESLAPLVRRAALDATR
jgi:hypothetical protein